MLLALCRRQAHLCWLSASLKAAWTALWPRRSTSMGSWTSSRPAPALPAARASAFLTCSALKSSECPCSLMASTRLLHAEREAQVSVRGAAGV